MRSRDRRHSLYRLLGSGLAASGLLGHGIAMLVVGLLAPSAAADIPPPYGEICTPNGLIAAPPSAGPDDERPEDQRPRPASGGQIDSCPVCTAFAQAPQGTLSSTLVVLCSTAAAAAPAPRRDAVPLAEAGLAPQSRGPPAVA